jgi:hypothetical protein
MNLILLLLLLPFLTFTKSVTYKAKFSFLPAGNIEIDIENQTVVVKGETEPPISWFYHYKLYMVYDLKNETKSYLYEEEGRRKRNYNFSKLLRKKPWLPIVVKLLSFGRNQLPERLKIKNLEIVLLKKTKDSITYKVKGSKNVKKITLVNWKENSFPESIVIDTGKTKLVLERIKK